MTFIDREAVDVPRAHQQWDAYVDALEARGWEIEESGAHVVLPGGPSLLMAASCPKTAEEFADLGYEPVVVDISEFEKLEGCVTCLSVRLPTKGVEP